MKDKNHEFFLPAIDDAPVLVEIELPDGSSCRWSLPANDPRVEKAFAILGQPDTLKL
jgi:hypothetical protein